jgi:RNA polymerase sigma factor (sigma-70 family)
MHALETAHADHDEAPGLRRFEALYRREFAFVWAAARHLGVPPGALDDVVQDVFLTAYRRLEHLRFEVSPRAWLFGVTRKVSFRYRRGAARRARRHDALAALSRPPAQAPQQRHDDAQQLERLLAGLSEPTRNVWQMTELLGMSAPEIASELGVPVNTVYSRLRLAREQLRTVVADTTLVDWAEAARQQQGPPAGAPQRAWVVLLPTLGHGNTGLGALAWLKTQAAMTTTMIAAGAVAVGLAVLPATRPASPKPAVATTTSVPARATPSPAATPEPPTIAAAPIVEPTTPPAERRLSSRTAPLQPADARARLAEEIALIDRAHAQLAANDPGAALATITTHAQKFPAGALADVREAARLDALCRNGDASGAEAIARRLQLDHPASAVAQRFANYHCTR